MRNRFDTQIEQVYSQMLQMGALIEWAIADAMKGLLEHDLEKAKQAIALEKEVNEKEKEIESLCLKLLMRQQPVAGDFRLISASLKMITDMERIADQAADIAEIAMIMKAPCVRHFPGVSEMEKAAVKMVSESIDAFTRRDLALARAVVEYDDVVDNYFLSLRQEIIDYIRTDIDDSEQALDLFMVIKYLERIGDHASNIAEWVVYAFSGVHLSEEDGDGPK